MRQGEMVRVSSKGQIVLPKRYRDTLKIRQGDYVKVRELDDGVLVLEKVQDSPLDVMFAGLRAEVKRRRFTRKDLEQAIKEVRAGRDAD